MIENNSILLQGHELPDGFEEFVMKKQMEEMRMGKKKPSKRAIIKGILSAHMKADPTPGQKSPIKEK